MQVREWAIYRVRIRPDLLQKIKDDAASGYRSVTSELTMILEKYFAQQEQAKKTEEAKPGSTPSPVSQQ
ncbi:hypothetical protein NKW43_14175 [Gluconobacter albidus]|uniref:hypothetical protein n=1 Tax=Gluconobacter albidus TaxID=318683 RepID=UPI0020A19707|nr:hypothetical protein [Gluconobacter albidus]MCP1274815.1 hypothetical protein [Gluconobacter albidus]